MSTETTDDQLARKVDDLKTEGWKVSEEGNERYVMKKPNYGSLGPHFLVALLTVWWTLGIGNVLYASWCYISRSDKRVVRPDD